MDQPAAGTWPDEWSDAALDAARHEGDEAVDALAREVLEAQDPSTAKGRLGYNALLDLADRLLDSPELYLVEQGTLRRSLNEYPDALRDYFDPQLAPEWLDERLLTEAAAVWDRHMLAIIAVLYAASLPSCYLIAKGIPALYATRKLGEPRFIYQRVYETGLMLDAVMRTDGLRVARDLPRALGDELEDEYARRDPGGAWRWDGDHLKPTGAPAATPPDPTAVLRELRSRYRSAPRYVWGPGLVAARKVRFLHASMRHYLLRPAGPAAAAGAPLRPAGAAGAGAAGGGPIPPQALASMRKSGQALLGTEGKAYDAACGVPANQEDLAYTLLTFGHVIPEGLAKWGIVLTERERAAFWHRWRLTGWLMGVKPSLLPEDPARAAALFRRIRDRQHGATEMGRTMTVVLQGFLAEYLPSWLARHLPAELIRFQMGPHAPSLLGPDRAPWWLRLGHRVATACLFPVNRLRRTGMRWFPLGAHWFGSVAHHAGHALIQSWRDGYDRRPFYVPDTVGAGGWSRARGVTPAFLARVTAWRSKLFNACVLAVGLLCTGALLLIAGAALLLFPAASFTCAALGILSIALGGWTLAARVPRIADQRPRRGDDGEDVLEHEPSGR